MLQEYKVWGFYHMTKPGFDLTAVGPDKIGEQAGYTLPEGVTIKILDNATVLLVKAVALVSAAYLI
jgi:hypothetical protein